VGVELRVDMPNVDLHGLGADLKARSSLTVGEAISEQPNHLRLTAVNFDATRPTESASSAK